MRILSVVRTLRPTKRNNPYSDADYQNALHAVVSGTMNAHRAAKTFGVPRMTIVDNLARIKRRIQKSP